MVQRVANRGLLNSSRHYLCWLNSIVQLLYRTHLPILLQGIMIMIKYLAYKMLGKYLPILSTSEALFLIFQDMMNGKIGDSSPLVASIINVDFTSLLLLHR